MIADKCLRVAAFLLMGSFSQIAAYESRTWTSTVGTTIDAALVEKQNRSVQLERADGTILTVRMDQLSIKDREYLDNLPEKKGKTTIEGIAARPGEISPKILCEDNSRWSYHLYLPSDFHDGREWPVLFVMSPGGGGGGGALKRYIEGAEMLGCVLAVSVESKNNFWESYDAIEAMVEDVHDRLPVIEELSFASGFSGGARMSYLLAERNKNFKGVIACGSGSGVYLSIDEFRAAKLRRSTYVYSLIGSNCFNRTGAYRSHEDFPKDFRLRYFIGGHTWAPAHLLKEAMARVMGAALADYRGSEADDLRTRYARSVWKMALAMEEDQPWEAHRWAEFLSEFPSEREIQNDASTLASKLSRQDDVRLAQKAERDIQEFGEEFFLDTNFKRDKEANPDRLEAAEELSDGYPSIPHGELFRRLGQKSS